MDKIHRYPTIIWESNIPVISFIISKSMNCSEIESLASIGLSW